MVDGCGYDVHQKYTTVDAGFKCTHLLRNQQEDVLKHQYEIDHTHEYGWVRVVKDVSSLHAHGVTNQESSLQTATRKETRACA